MIPKIIHYCWFGRNPKPALTEKYLKSWKKYCPDFTIREWNEDSLDLSAAPLYVRQAYEAGKWAFVSDYVRLLAMTREGGVYMDTDVELVRPLEPFLKNRAFCGFETKKSISTGVMACEQGFPLFGEFLRHYDEVSFYHDDGSLNVTTNVETVTAALSPWGLRLDGREQTVAELTIYPSYVFSPVDFETGVLHRKSKTVAIHWFSGSWYTAQEQAHRETLRRKARRAKLTDPVKRAVHSCLGDEGMERWQERLRRYRSWEEFSKIPRRVLRKLLGKSNAEE